ncbi:metalloregulator ArsR/SmtB family transcription factor [Fusibacter bizertensis]|jgi:transcriptional regulator, ArsR family|uniref:Metalloregulator ArsR/SmtB family transcription factor n=1 Tax=Fusibacter bizertensis TaxID=1488331 RepID=A0ABT6ND17_9FIRM|nr:metalloregulator ArsR/SmtB family transcription factor [Fusibacter bizertensis]MDH8678309.1 metalloregulator ArsR/SmtB family transcription factor [Fusibacter bizertensis]
MKKQNQSEDRCECNVIHQESIDKVKLVIPSNDDLGLLADFFKVFGDQTRVKILSALSVSELCVCDIAFLLGMTQSAISHQLRVLKQARLVKSRKEGKVVYYMLDDDHVKQIIGLGLVHNAE